MKLANMRCRIFRVCQHDSRIFYKEELATNLLLGTPLEGSDETADCYTGTDCDHCQRSINGALTENMDLTLETTQFSAVTYVDKGATQEKVQKCKNAKAIK